MRAAGWRSVKSKSIVNGLARAVQAARRQAGLNETHRPAGALSGKEIEMTEKAVYEVKTYIREWYEAIEGGVPCIRTEAQEEDLHTAVSLAKKLAAEEPGEILEVRQYPGDICVWSSETSVFLGYEVSRSGRIKASACCNECRAGSRGEMAEYGQGHFQCDGCPKDLLAAETLGLVSAHYEDGWRWYVNQNANPMIVAGLAFDALYDLQRQVNLFLRKAISLDTLRKAVE